MTQHTRRIRSFSASGSMAALMLALALGSSPLAYAASDPLTSDAYGSFFRQENLLRLQVSLPARPEPLGALEVYRHPGGVLVPLEELLLMLGYEAKSPVEGVVELRGGGLEQVLMIDLPAAQVVAASATRLIGSNQAFMHEGRLYVDTRLLDGLLPQRFTVQEANLTLAVTGGESDAPTPEPSEPVLLILQPQYKKYATSDIFVEVYQHEKEQYYVAFDALFEALKLQADISQDGRQVSGWITQPNDAYTLDLSNKTLRYRDQEQSVQPEDFRLIEGELFINLEAYKRWFGLQLSVQHQRMALHVQTTEHLPLDEQEERRARWARIEQARQARQEENYLPLDAPYTVADWPFVDVNLNQNYDSDSVNSPHSTNFSVISSGDLGYMTTDVFASGNSDGAWLDSLRVKAGRKDTQGGLLGGLKATEYAFGDIDSMSLPLIARTGIGRGVSVTNRPLDVSADFDSKTFTGDAVPGWEVELYRNNALLDVQVVDSNGRYTFEDVPILFGNNNFRLVFYGPQGQIEERAETFYAGATIVPQGAWQYSFSAGEKASTLFNVDELASVRNPQGFKTVAEVEYGVTDSLTLGSGYARTPLQDGDHDYLHSSASLSLGGVFTNLALAQDQTNNGLAGSLSALTSIEDISIRAQQRLFDGFVSEEEENLDNPHTSITDLDLNGQFDLPVLDSFNLGLQGTHEQFEVGVDRTTYRARISRPVLGFSVTDSVNYITDTSDRITNSLAVNGRIEEFLIRSVVDYQFKPTSGFSALNLAVQRRIDEQLVARTQILKNFGEAQRTSVLQTFTWDMEDYRLSLQGEADDDHEMFFGINIGFSLGGDPRTGELYMQNRPMAGGGAVMGRVFVDDNYNNVYDDGEAVLPDAALRVNRRRYDAQNGVVMAAPTPPWQESIVTVDLKTVEDPLMVPGVEGYRVMTRPGQVAYADFPMISTSELDGVVMMEAADGSRHEVADAVVSLVDAQGKIVHQVISEYDGFYFIDRVTPGTYRLRVDGESLRELHAVQTEEPQLTIGKESDFYNDNTIVITPDGIAADASRSADTPAAPQAEEHVEILQHGTSQAAPTEQVTSSPLEKAAD